MAIRALRVKVLGPTENEFYTIEQMLALCGVYRYEVTAECNPADAMCALEQGDADCYIIGTEALQSWFKDEVGLRADLLPIVSLGKPFSPEMVQLDPDDLSLGQLLMAMRDAMRTRVHESTATKTPALTMAMAS